MKWILFLTLPFAAAAQDAAVNVKLRHAPAQTEAISGWIDANLPSVVEAYKHAHQNPELSLQEFKTSAKIARELEAAGYEVTSGVGKTGVVGILKNGEGPMVLIRGDMDALPVIEQTGLPYASKVRIQRPDGTTVGTMHACGHDVHIAMVIGVGRLLADLREHWSGTVMMIGQPAEEIGRGAKFMIADGLFERFGKPDFCLSLHVKNDLPVGQVGYTSGWGTANVDSVDITIFGKGGHGAQPQATVDPIVTAAHVITGLQSIVSRRVHPIEPAVVTVGSIHGGSKHNIIPDEVKLQLTVRSYKDEVRNLLLESIRQITVDTCKMMGCPKEPVVDHDEEEYTPAGYNHPGLTGAAMELFRGLLGAENVVDLPPTMGGEDFARFAKHLNVPGLQYRVGTIPRETWDAAQKPGADPLPSLHSALYYPEPEPTMRLSLQSMANLAMGLMGKAP